MIFLETPNQHSGALEQPLLEIRKHKLLSNVVTFFFVHKISVIFGSCCKTAFHKPPMGQLCSFSSESGDEAFLTSPSLDS